MAHVVMACRAVLGMGRDDTPSPPPLYSYGLYSYGPYSYGLPCSARGGTRRYALAAAAGDSVPPPPKVGGVLAWINDADRRSYYCGLTMPTAVHIIASAAQSRRRFGVD